MATGHVQLPRVCGPPGLALTGCLPMPSAVLAGRGDTGGDGPGDSSDQTLPWVPSLRLNFFP